MPCTDKEVAVKQSKMRKALKWAVVPIAIGSLLALSACTSTTPSTSGDKFSGNLNVQVYGDWPFVKTDAALFMKAHPKANIKVGVITNDTLRSSGGRLFTSSDSPDVVSYTLQQTQMQSWIKAGALLPLDDLWKSADIASTVSKDSATQSTADDGHKYAVPLGLTLLPFGFYNTDLWSKAGATAPDSTTHEFASLDEFNSDLAKVKASGVTPFSAEGDWSEYAFSSLIASSCGTTKYVDISTNWKKGADSAPKYTDDCVIKAIDQWDSWGKAGYFPEGLASVTNAQDQALFDTQKSAMWLAGSWVPPVYTPKFNWDWSLLPSLGGGRSPIGTSLDSFLVPKGAKNPALAKSFISYLIEKSTLEGGMGRIPARTDLDISKVISTPVTQSIYAALPQATTAPAWFTLIPPSVEAAFLQSVVSGSMTGSISSEDAAKALQAASDQYRSSLG